jgi:hypothetical protein
MLRQPEAIAVLNRLENERINQITDDDLDALSELGRMEAVVREIEGLDFIYCNCILGRSRDWIPEHWSDVPDDADAKFMGVHQPCLRDEALRYCRRFNRAEMARPHGLWCVTLMMPKRRRRQ